MKAFIILSVVACASAQIIAPYAGLTYAGLPYAPVLAKAEEGEKVELKAPLLAAGLPYGLPYGGYPYGLPYAAGFAPVVAKAAEVAPAPVAVAPVASTGRVLTVPAIPQASQFQSQDEFGNLAYGYANINSAKQEAGNTYGGVTGSYSYTDSNGIVQTVNYIADGLGFRVQATNLPVAPVADLKQPIFDLEQPIHQYELPIAPTFNPAPLAAVVDTPEVAAAKAEFQIAFDEAASRAKRSTPAATAPLPALPATLPYAGLGYAGLPYAAGLGYAGLPYAAGLGLAGHPYAAGLGLAGYPYAAGLGLAGYPYAAPVAAAPIAAAPIAAPAAVVASAPASRAAVKTVILNNPGHAESYIVN